MSDGGQTPPAIVAPEGDDDDAPPPPRDYGGSIRPAPRIDRISTPLNACSLEVLHRALPLDEADSNFDSDGGASGGSHRGGRRVLPLVIGCYQLDEGSGGLSDCHGSVNDDEDGETGGDGGPPSGPSRSGELRLHLVPADAGRGSEDGGDGAGGGERPPPFPPYSFGGPPVQVLTAESGVL